MATISNTPRPGYVWDATDNCWYPIGTGPHSHADYITAGSAINPNIVDAKGDIIAATAADTVARLAVGSNDQVLTADSSTATGLKWATPSSGISWTQLASANFPTGTGTVTISGLSGGLIYILFDGMSPTASNGVFGLRLNGDTGNNYYYANGDNAGVASLVQLVTTDDGAATSYSGGIVIYGASSSSSMKFIDTGFYPNTEGQSKMYKSTSAITSATLFLNNANFDAGSYQIWKA